ncbi:class I SAM-dependent methyltransferase [Planomonospora sp. ID67723]|uniref:class I SAM-dependent methyltransferase n=1 Tax=Planomonospora sp. ID67723 TaxID=2738134 RepID=UPI0018C44F88|nr:class I SAM-dependent methyltransferase [Planomonospora sp. ID67723]MBG0831891.1 class I SAM-dependent methyltransferase [Planomonospora sp. ID67723]
MNAHASMFGFFNHAGLYDRMSRVFGFRRIYTRAVADVVRAGLSDGARILDVGTGPGRVPIAIVRACPGLRAEGVDLSAGMIAHARRAAAGDDRVGFTVGDVADLPYPDEAFDLVVSTMSQHHWGDPGTGVRELRRVLRPGGQLWIYDFTLALRRAEIAARAAFPRYAVRREPVSALVGKLVVRPV